MSERSSLVEARLQCHWALQLAATPGRTLMPPQPDDSHTTFRWDHSRRALIQDDPFRSGLRLNDLTLLLGSDELGLDRRTFDEGFAWLSARAPGLRRELNAPLPDHPVAHGARFSLTERPFQVLNDWYAQAADVLGEIQEDVRCWPHHFDIATLLLFEQGTKTIGCGFSPGDGEHPEPYWYVNHWPATESSRRRALAGGGIWNNEGWIGALLPAQPGGEPRAFLKSAVSASRELLEEHA